MANKPKILNLYKNKNTDYCSLFTEMYEKKNWKIYICTF